MKEKIQQTASKDFVLEMTRELPFPREKVFESFASFEAMAIWFGPHGSKVTEGSLDFTVGGSYRLVIEGEGKNVVGGIYRQITPPDKIEFTWQWEPQEDMPTEEMEITIEFRELEEGETELYLRQTKVPDQTAAESHAWGWGETFERLAVTLGAIGKQSTS